MLSRSRKGGMLNIPVRSGGVCRAFPAYRQVGFGTFLGKQKSTASNKVSPELAATKNIITFTACFKPVA
jgi:hypothetical protein